MVPIVHIYIQLIIINVCKIFLPSPLSCIYTRVKAKEKAIFLLSLLLLLSLQKNTQFENNATDWKQHRFHFPFWSSINECTLRCVSMHDSSWVSYPFNITQQVYFTLIFTLFTEKSTDVILFF